MEEKASLLDKVSSALEMLIKWLASTLMLVAGLLVSVEVFFRYIVGKPHDYSDEVVLYLAVSGALLGAAIASRHARHTKIDILIRVVRKGRKKALLEILNYSATIAVCILLAWAGFLHSLFLKDLGLFTPSSLPIPLWLVNMALPIGLTLCCFFTVERLIKLFIRQAGDKGE